MQKTFFEVMKQFQGEYMGSFISGMLESMAGYGRADQNEMSTGEAIDKGLTKAVKDFASRFPPEWRLSKNGRAQSERATARDDEPPLTPPLPRPVVGDRRRLPPADPRRPAGRSRGGGGTRRPPPTTVVR